MPREAEVHPGQIISSADPEATTVTPHDAAACGYAVCCAVVLIAVRACLQPPQNGVPLFAT